MVDYIVSHIEMQFPRKHSDILSLQIPLVIYEIRAQETPIEMMRSINKLADKEKIGKTLKKHYFGTKLFAFLMS